MTPDHVRVPGDYFERRAHWLAGTVTLSAAAASYDPLVAHRDREERRAQLAADAESDRLQAAVVAQLRAEQLHTARAAAGRKAWAAHLRREDAPAPTYLDDDLPAVA